MPKDATEEKSYINKEEEEYACLTDVEMKRSYIGALRNTFTSRKSKREENYFEPEHISPHKRNKENGLDNGLAILDEIWSKQRSAHDISGLGYKQDKEVKQWTPRTKFEGGTSSSKY